VGLSQVNVEQITVLGSYCDTKTCKFFQVLSEKNEILKGRKNSLGKRRYYFILNLN